MKRILLRRWAMGMILVAMMLVASNVQVFAAKEKVYNWQPASWATAGFWWDHLVYTSEYLNKMSNGRINMIPSQPGAVVAVPMQLDSVSNGTTPAMAPPAAYYAGKLPVASVWSTPPLVRNVADMIDLMDYFEEGRAGKIWKEGVEERWNVKVVGHMYGPADTLISSRVPIRSLADLKGKKFRVGSSLIAKTMKKFGAATVFAPGPEIYTMLSANTIDGVVYGSPYDNYVNSLHEVTKYWIKNSLNSTHCTTFVVNRDVWNSMSEDLQEMVKVAIDASNHRITNEGYAKIEKTWDDVQKKGIEVITWSDDDQLAWSTALLETADGKGTDPQLKEFMSILRRWGKVRGLLE